MLSIRFVEGSTAPRFDESVTELACEEVVVTEQGTVAHLPMVDIRMRDAEGKLHLLVLTGRMVNMLSAAIRGVNMRIHGVEEP